MFDHLSDPRIRGMLQRIACSNLLDMGFMNAQGHRHMSALRAHSPHRHTFFSKDRAARREILLRHSGARGQLVYLGDPGGREQHANTRPAALRHRVSLRGRRVRARHCAARGVRHRRNPIVQGDRVCA